MADPLRQEVLLDISRAQAQISKLESDLAQLNQAPIQLAFDVPTESKRAFDEIEQAVISVEENIRQVNNQLDLMEVAAGSTQVEVKQLAAALGVSEDEAQALVGRFAQSRVEARQMDAAVKGVAQALGLSNAEARQFAASLKQAEQAADRTDTAVESIGTRGTASFGSLTGTVTRFVTALAAFQGLRILGRGVAEAISDASDLEESLSKTNVVFGDFAESIEKVAEDAPRALGLSTQAALESTATFGNLFTALGLTQQAAAELSPEIVQLAADLASFNNISVDEAIISLRSGLVGEVEPLRRLGVAINAATVEAKAMELGLVDASGEVSEAAKVQARYALILEQTTNAQGDYARTADGIANTQRTLRAEFENISAQVGQALLPAYEALLDLAPTLTQALENMVPVVASIAASMADATPSAENFGNALQLFGEIPAATGNVVGFARGIAELAAAFPRAILAQEDFFSGLRGGIDQIGDTVENLRVDQFRNELVDMLQSGIEPAQALGNVLLQLQGDLQLDPTDLEQVAAAFADIANLDATTASRLAGQVRAIGESAGLTAEEVEALRTAILGLTGPQRLGFGLPRVLPADEIEATAESLLSEAEALAILQDAADNAGVTIAGLVDSQAELEPAVAAAAGSISASTLEYLRQVDAINELDVATGALPGSIEAARDAMEDAEGEIVSDFSTFLENLRTTVAEQQEFDLGLALLRTLGLDDLAAQFEAAGIEALDLVNEALADPDKAREAERLLDGEYVGVGESIKDDVLEGLEGEEINTALVQSLIDAAAQADTPEVRQAFLTLAAELGKELEVSATVVPVFSPEAVRFFNEGGRQGEGQGGTNGGLTPNGFNLIINNPTTQDLNTDAARAAQTISSVVRVRSGAQ